MLYILQDALMKLRMVMAIHQLLCVAKEDKLLIDLLPLVHKALAVRLAYIGKQPYGGLYDALQLFHFPGLRDAGLENAQSLLLLHLPYGKRHPYLRVIALGAAYHIIIAAEQLV